MAGGESVLRNGHFYSAVLSRNHSDTVLQLLAVEDNLAPSRANFGRCGLLIKVILILTLPQG